MTLRYTGGGYGGFLRDIPARDLTDEEAEKFGKESLVKSGLYIEEKQKQQSYSRKASEVTDERH